MSTPVVAALLVLDVAMTVAVVRFLVRWWRGSAPAPAADAERWWQGPLTTSVPEQSPEEQTAGEPAPAVSQVLVPTLTVLPRVPFVPPPRREWRGGRVLRESLA